MKEGYVDVPAGPGTGIDVNEEILEERAYDGAWDSPRLYAEDDGTVVDW